MSASDAADGRLQFGREQIFDAIERIDREAVEEAQDLRSGLPDAVLGHGRNEDGAAGFDRRLLAVDRDDPLPRDHAVNLRRSMPVQLEPVAGVKLGDAAGDAVGRRAALGEERPPADAALARIVPAVRGDARLVEDEGFGALEDVAHAALASQDAPFSLTGEAVLPYGRSCRRRRQMRGLAQTSLVGILPLTLSQWERGAAPTPRPAPAEAPARPPPRARNRALRSARRVARSGRSLSRCRPRPPPPGGSASRASRRARSEASRP